MKQFVPLFFLLLTFSFSLQATSTSHHPDPLLVVVLMVKNEEHCMAQTLQPFVDAGISSYFIFDTGSTDRTIEVTKEFFDLNHITSFYIEQEPFVDFSVSRNRALELTEHYFPNAGFMLMVDAEWYMHNADELLSFCQSALDEKSNCYLVRIFACSLDYYLPRLFRVGRNVRYFGVVHETVDGIDGQVPSTMWFEVKPTHYGAEKTKQRMSRDRDLLLAYIAEHPQSARDTFYLAQTFSCLKDWENGYHYYLKRTTMNGWDQETFMAWYRLGQIAEIMGEEKKDHEWWQKALDYYLKAFSLRPWRAEPLIRVAHHYHSKKEYTSAYVFVRSACDIAYPAQDILFIEKDLYLYYRFELLSQCAAVVGAHAIGQEATQLALKSYPEDPHLLRNLAFYIDAQKRMENKSIEVRDDKGIMKISA